MKSVLGVTLGHDTSFAHVVDGKVVAVMEAERYFRQKRYKLHCLTMSLNCVMRSSQPSGVTQVSSQHNSACSFTVDCTTTLEWAGSMPAARNTAAVWRIFSRSSAGSCSCSVSLCSGNSACNGW